MLSCVLAVKFCISSVKLEVVTDNINKDGARFEAVYFGCKCAFKGVYTINVYLSSKITLFILFLSVFYMWFRY